ILLFLLPLGLTQQAGSYLSEEDFLDRDKLIERVIAQGRAGEPSPGRRIWELLDGAARQGLEQKPSEPFAKRMRYIHFENALRAMLARSDFYRPQDWAGVRLPAEARTLESKGLALLHDDQVARFNRLALEAAFPEWIAPTPPKQIQLAYFNWELGIPLPLEP